MTERVMTDRARRVVEYAERNPDVTHVAACKRCPWVKGFDSSVNAEHLLKLHGAVCGSASPPGGSGGGGGTARPGWSKIVY